MRARQLVVVAVLGAVSAAGCGSSATRATRATPTTLTTPTPSRATGADAAIARAAAATRLHGSTRVQFCDLARQDRAAFDGATAATASRAQVKELYESVASALDQARSAAPGVIQRDFDTFMAAYTPYSKALAAANYDPAKMSPDATQSLGSAKVRVASAHITQYVQQVCKVKTTPAT